MSSLISNKDFNSIDFTKELLSANEYEQCSFKNCNFADLDLSNIVFIDSSFDKCNLSMVKINNTSFKEVSFADSKLLGLNFCNCNGFLLSMSFKDCQIDFASFVGLDIKKIKFINSSLIESDFSEANLSSAVFENCDLEKSVFFNTNLEKADFRHSYAYSINPEKNKIKSAKFSMPDVLGLLDKYKIIIE